MSVRFTFGLEDDEHAALMSIAASLTHLEELFMALNAQAQAIVDAINASTNKMATAVSDTATAIGKATQAITDLAAQIAAGIISPAEFQTAIQPNLDTLNTAADSLEASATALTDTATANDPALQAPPSGGETPVTPAP